MTKFATTKQNLSGRATKSGMPIQSGHVSLRYDKNYPVGKGYLYSVSVPDIRDSIDSRPADGSIAIFFGDAMGCLPAGWPDGFLHIKGQKPKE